MIAKITNISIHRVGDEWGINAMRDDGSSVDRFPVPAEAMDALLAYAGTLKTPTEAALDAVLQAIDSSSSDKALAKAVRAALVKKDPDSDDPVTVYDPEQNQTFSLGEKVEYTDGKIYTSKLSENVWSPAQYPAGWELVEEEKDDGR